MRVFVIRVATSPHTLMMDNNAVIAISKLSPVGPVSHSICHNLSGMVTKIITQVIWPERTKHCGQNLS